MKKRSTKRSISVSCWKSAVGWTLVVAGFVGSSPGGDNPPRLTVRPLTFFAGATVHLQCRVPRDSRNSGITLGFEDYRLSSEELDGLNARVTFDFFVERVPCSPGPAVCVVRRAQDEEARAVVNVNTAGCR